MLAKKIMTVLLCGAAIASCSPRNVENTASTSTQVSTPQSTALLLRRERPPIASVRGSYSSFEEWKSLLISRALDSGISPSVIERAKPYMNFKQQIVNSDRNQSEFKQTIMDYVERRVSDTRINLGKNALSNYGPTLKQIANAYNVDESVLVGIWGMETNFGGFMGGINVFTAMSTLAYEGRRRDWAEKQIINALYIVQKGDRNPADMEGSWGGGLGHTQFIPEMYNIYAIDFSGDGRRDVWNPVDALASTANFLRNESFKPGLRWGTEVRLPAGFDSGQASKTSFRDASYWKSVGVTALSSRGLPNAPLAIYIPEGANGRAFAVTSNFKAIKRYNNSDAYALAVALLGDAVLGY